MSADRPMRDPVLGYVRWGLTTALAYLVLFDQTDEIGVSELVFVVALLASNPLVARLERWIRREWSPLVQVAVDSTLVILGLYLADSASQELVVGYFLCVLLASFADSERRLIGLSLLAAGLYAFVGLRDAGDVWGSALLLRFPLLVFVTLSHGLLVTRLRAEQIARAAAERKVVSLEAVIALTRELSTLSTAEILERTRLAVAGALSSRDCRLLRAEELRAATHPIVAAALCGREPVVRRSHEGRGIDVAVPLHHDAVPLAMILAEVDRSTELSSEEIEFCLIAAGTAGLALGNARRYEELIEIERTKTNFLRNLSHEMHTPLHAILGFADIAKQSLDEAEAGNVRRSLERITARASEMSTHVEHLLRLSQLTLGRERPTPSLVDLREIFSRSVAEARRAAAPGVVEVHLELSTRLNRVIVDGEKLERILACLLLNAVKFAAHGRIEVAADLRGNDRLRVAVRDDGAGVAPGDSKRIFNDFEQGDGSMTRRYPGLGLGLAVSRRLVDLLGGEIKVASDAGRGSTFEVVLPVTLPLAA